MLATRLKIIFVNVVIVLGSLVIAVLQWPEAVKNGAFGPSRYNQGPMGTIMLTVLMAGIPIVLFAAATYLALTHLLFRRGGIDDGDLCGDATGHRQLALGGRAVVHPRGEEAPRDADRDPRGVPRAAAPGLHGARIPSQAGAKPVRRQA